jgi:hypothetical protein
VDPPVGPTGLRYCSGDGSDLVWRLGVAGSFSDTRLTFSGLPGGAVDASFTRWAIAASLDRRLGDRWTAGAMLGSNLVGSLDAQGVSSSMSPGPLGALTLSFRPLDEGHVAPFVLLSASVAAALAWTTPPAGGGRSTITSYDVRLGVAAGKTIADVVTPYLVARAFGGPVLWSIAGTDVTGTDAYHYQLGAGAAVRIGRVDVVAEGIPLGERSAVVGIGLGF